MLINKVYDVIIIGGNNAGLSAALALGRSRRQVLVIDAGKPANRTVIHSHGFLTRDGETPAQLAALSREEVSRYPSISFRADTVVSAARLGSTFVITTADGGQFQSLKVLLATGMEYVLPAIPGLAECWGKSVAHCPYCHGYEVSDQPLGVIVNGEAGYDYTTLIRQWSHQLTLFTNGTSTLTDEQWQTLWQLGVPIIEAPITAIAHQQGMVTAVRLVDGREVPVNALFVHVSTRQPTNLADQLGCIITEAGVIQCSEFGETTVPGVFAAGDNSTLLRSIASAVANGYKAGAWINKELIKGDIHLQIQSLPIINSN